MSGGLLTTEQAASAVFVTPEVVRQWKRRKLLPVAGFDSRNRPLFRHSDVLATERRTRTFARTGQLALHAVTLLEAGDVCPEP